MCPDALGNFCVFCEKFVIISVIQVRPVNFFPPNFVKHYQTPQAPSSCFGAGQIFLRCENRTEFARHDLRKNFLSAPTITKLKMWQRQILSRFLDGGGKQILSVQCVRTVLCIVVYGGTYNSPYMTCLRISHLTCKRFRVVCCKK